MINEEDKILIRTLWESKGHGARRLIREFPKKRTGNEEEQKICWESYKKLVCLIIVREVADHRRAAVTTFLLFHFHKVAQVRYLGEVNMFLTYV